MGRWGWGSDKGGMSVQSMGEVGKDFCPNFLQSFLENIDRRSCDDGGWQLIPIFNNPHRKCRPSSSEAARTLEYLEGVPSQATSRPRRKKIVRLDHKWIWDSPIEISGKMAM